MKVVECKNCLDEEEELSGSFDYLLTEMSEDTTMGLTVKQKDWVLWLVSNAFKCEEHNEFKRGKFEYEEQTEVKRDGTGV